MILFIHILLSILYIFPSLNKPHLSYHFTIEKHSPHLKFEVYNSFVSEEEFCIGTPYQCIKVQFDPETAIMAFHPEEHFSTSFPQAKHHLFNHQSSSTYNKITTYAGFYSTQKMITGSLVSDNIAFNPIKISNEVILLSNNWINEFHYSSIGLSYLKNEYKERPNFLYILQYNHIIENKRFIIEFNDDNKGKITYDNYDIANNTKYNKAFSLKIEDYFICCNYFSIPQAVLFIDNHPIELKQDIKGIFDESFKYISIPISMSQPIYENLLLNKSNCVEQDYVLERIYEKGKDVNIKYTYYLCSRDSIKYSATARDAQIVFQFDNGNLSLKYEDMFDDYDRDNVIFNVIFKEGNTNYPDWVIGYPILKHHMVERDFDNYMFTVYNICKKSINKGAQPSIIFSLVRIANIIMILGLFLISIVLYKTKGNK